MGLKTMGSHKPHLILQNLKQSPNQYCLHIHCCENCGQIWTHRRSNSECTSDGDTFRNPLTLLLYLVSTSELNLPLSQLSTREVIPVFTKRKPIILIFRRGDIQSGSTILINLLICSLARSTSMNDRICWMVYFMWFICIYVLAAQAVRLMVRSDDAQMNHPLLVTVRQPRGVTSWSLPYVESG